MAAQLLASITIQANTAEEGDTCINCEEEIPMGADFARMFCCGQGRCYTCIKQLQSTNMELQVKVVLKCMYCQNPYIIPDSLEETELIRRWANEEKTWALCRLSERYQNGEAGCEQSYQRAAELLEIAASKGSACAQNLLGNMYHKGQGVAQSDKRSNEYIETAAKQDFEPALVTMGVIFRDGIGVHQNYEKAIEYYTRAVELHGSVNALMSLAAMYGNGVGVDQSDEKTAEYYEAAAKQGHANSQFNLGIMYDQGRGVDQSNEKAAEYFEAAARQGNTLAQFNLGNLYLNGQGVNQSDEKAAEYFKAAATPSSRPRADTLGLDVISARQGDAGAQCNLGKMYAEGRGTEQSFETARGWWIKAAEQGMESIDREKISSRNISLMENAIAELQHLDECEGRTTSSVPALRTAQVSAAGGRGGGGGSSGASGSQRSRGKKIKPNAPCPCGSGKKYKKCCKLKSK